MRGIGNKDIDRITLINYEVMTKSLIKEFKDKCLLLVVSNLSDNMDRCDMRYNEIYDRLELNDNIMELMSEANIAFDELMNSLNESIDLDKIKSPMIIKFGERLKSISDNDMINNALLSKVSGNMKDIFKLIKAYFETIIIDTFNKYTDEISERYKVIYNESSEVIYKHPNVDLKQLEITDELDGEMFYIENIINYLENLEFKCVKQQNNFFILYSKNAGIFVLPRFEEFGESCSVILQSILMY